MNITLEQTCGACPEQYDAKDEHGSIVGYLRLRHGYFSVQASGPDYAGSDGGVLVYEARPAGDGVFGADERQQYLDAAVRAIRAHLEPGPAADPEALRGKLTEALRRKAVADWPEGGDGPLVIEIYLTDAVSAVLGVISPETHEENDR